MNEEKEINISRFLRFIFHFDFLLRSLPYQRSQELGLRICVATQLKTKKKICLLIRIIPMRSGASSLNPYAASYVPLSKREADVRTSVAEKDSMNHDGRTVWFPTSQCTTEDQLFPDSSTYAAKKLPAPEAFQGKSKTASSSYGSSSHSVTELTEKQLPDEDPDMDIEYLRMEFPGISTQSLRDVYMLNEGDLEASLDMLNQLEFDEPSGSLPETLDIGDVSESGLPAESTSLKLKNVAAEASTSSNPSSSASVL